MARLAPLIVWLVGAAGLLAWAALSEFHVGRMALPRSQALAIACCVLVAATLGGAWLWMLARWIGRRAGWVRTRTCVDRPAIRAALLALLGLAVLTVTYGRYVEPRWLVVRQVALGREPPAGRRAIRLAVVSDLHVAGDRAPWRRLPELVNSTDPDVVLFLGDALARRSALPVLQRTLRRIKARHAKLAVWGNWERWYHGELPLLDGTGFRWVHGRRVTLTIEGQRLHLVGLAYRDAETGARGQRLLAAAPRRGWRIFLYHTPDLADAVSAADLYLAGHTHGGQIALPLFGALVTLSRHGKRFERGLRRVAGTALYVNPGIGVEPLIPLRLGVRPEVTLLRLGAPPRRR